jgi:glycosyltransferase involved in cell wall biosynthesis
VGSNLRPYIDPVSFHELVTEEQKYQTEEFKGYFKEKYKFSGKYGANLMEEVARYAMVAGAIAQQHEFDVIHAHDWLTNLAGIAAKKVSGKPLVIHVHATEFDRTGENVNPEVFRLEQTGMREADKVITVSNLTRNIVINKYGIDPSKVITVHNAVDFSGRSDVEVQRGVKEKIVTFLGRITFQKGPEYFIEAANKVLKMYPNVRFVMAGSGDLMNRSIKRVAQLGISDRFHLTGFLRGQDVQRMFAYSDVYVMPSVSEPFGISPLEAMISNVPTIISKQSGVAEVLKYAIKVDFWDIDALADAIYGLLNYPALSKMAIESGLEEVNSLKWDHAASKVKKVYEAAINEKK